MPKLNIEGKQSQTEVLKMVENKLNEIYVELISKNPGHIQVVTFSLLFIVKEGSVQGTVSFESVAKLKNGG